MELFIFELGLILGGAALLSYAAVMLKQPIIIAYIACGMIIGPGGLGWVQHVEFIETISHLGITLLLFLAGLCLHPQRLTALFRKTALVTLSTSAASFVIAFLIGLLFRFSAMDSLCIGLALMFSSTILVVKLIPTTALHHEKMGATCISVLIMQDLLAIAVLAFVSCLGAPQGAVISFLILSAKLCVFIAALVTFEYFVLRNIMAHVERLHEALFILGLAWCFGIASISNSMGLFCETGAFFAGVVMARHIISRFISEALKPLRDFFLVLFFFTLGAQLDVLHIRSVLVPAAVLTLVFIIVKPWIFETAFLWTGEKAPFAKEAGLRLGQFSEFSLLIALLALESGCISGSASQLIQIVTIFTFIVSSYIVVLNCPTPIGISAKLTKD